MIAGQLREEHPPILSQYIFTIEANGVYIEYTRCSRIGPALCLRLILFSMCPDLLN